MHALESKILTDWHWYYDSFSWYEIDELRQNGIEHSFAKSIIDACLLCEEKSSISGFKFIDRISELSGKEKYLGHYEQLLQQLSELFVFQRLLSLSWPSPPIFEWEPGANQGKKNPELLIHIRNFDIAYEVKAPSLLQHSEEHRNKKIQISDRAQGLKEIAEILVGENNLSLPKDNTLKDFLISANNKFNAIKTPNRKLYGLLVVLWDDFIYEPISALISQNSGLFTKNSFLNSNSCKDTKFSNVDGVIIIRHLRQFMLACAEEHVPTMRPLLYGCQHAMDFDYGETDSPKVFIQNPNGKIVPEEVYSTLGAIPWSPDLPTAYHPQEIIFWFKV